MSLTVGSRIAHYDVTALIGEGGMGQVYQATDTKLNRQVALKILPEAFATDPDRLARFQREAQVLASLNHPNIAQIHGIEEDGGTRALVLELVEGPTLADRIAKGPIPLDEALPIAKQIAEALEAAHEAGVIHRDLKPANIKVREDGTVKVLDFGLAKALDPNPTGDPSQSPTLTAAATQMGVIMGTAAYMSPEQVRGKPVDKRADIWSFGVVLYEMLTGQRAFQGEDVSVTLADVIRADLKWEKLPNDLPPTLATYLRRCLEKEPSQRIRDIGDVRLAMEGAFESPLESGRSSRRSGWQSAARLALAGLVVALVAGLVVLQRQPPDSPLVTRLALQLPGDVRVLTGPGIEFATTSDGRMVVFTGTQSGRTQLYRHALDRVAPEPIPGTDGARTPFLSPDDQTVGFIVDRELRRVPLAGGPVATVIDVPAEAIEVRGVVWLPDDTIVFGTNNGLWRAPSTGGQRELLTTLDPEKGETWHVNPALLPDGQTLMFGVYDGGPSRVETLSLQTGERTALLDSTTKAHFLEPGYLVFAEIDDTGGTTGLVWSVPFDPDRLEVLGEPVLAVENVMVGDNEAQFTVTGNGTLVTIPIGEGGAAPRTLAWVDQEGEVEPLPELSAAPYPRSVDVSPDGTRLALEVADGPNMQDASDVWTYDLIRGTLNRLTTFAGWDQTPLWTPDGRQVVYGSTRDDVPGLYLRNADGTGDAEHLYSEGRILDIVAKAWTPDGGGLVVTRRIRRLQSDISLLRTEGEPALEVLFESEFRESKPDVMPNGGWIAYQSNRSGRDEVYVERFPDLGDRQLVSLDGGQQPRWSPDGRTLFYLDGQANRMMTVPILTTEPELSLGTPVTLVEGQFWNIRGRAGYDVAPDGRLMTISRGSATLQINVVLNWAEELKALVPVP